MEAEVRFRSIRLAQINSRGIGLAQLRIIRDCDGRLVERNAIDGNALWHEFAVVKCILLTLVVFQAVKI